VAARITYFAALALVGIAITRHSANIKKTKPLDIFFIFYLLFFLYHGKKKHPASHPSIPMHLYKMAATGFRTYCLLATKKETR
jgi:hypothetical protein